MQHTLAGPAQFAGVGVHKGGDVRIRVWPAAADNGVVFRRIDLTDVDNLVPARAQAVCDTRMGTVVGNASGVTVATIEHLMATLCALGIDNAVIDIDGPEVPIMDGSALAFLRGLDRAGRRPLRKPRRSLELLRTVEVSEGRKRAALSPAADFEVAFEILFDSPVIGRQSVDLVVDEASFRRELADCRTFGFSHEVETLRGAGLAHGASLENVVVIEHDRVLNPGGLRRPDEFVRHKALDAIGDLHLLGAPILGRYEGRYAGHALNNALARALLADPSAWRFAYPSEALARAG
ncbi:MAG TPA: UDP-3-O-acyl-N-acetylglucosamine deacetylase [Caulobacteraceae bacterium]